MLISLYNHHFLMNKNLLPIVVCNHMCSLLLMWLSCKQGPVANYILYNCHNTVFN